MRALMMTKKAGWGRWQPWANCVAYYPLENDFNDYSWHGYNLTNNWIVLGTSADWYQWAYLESWHYAYTTDFDLPHLWNRTIAFWTGCQTLVQWSWTIAIFLSFYPYTNVSDWIGYSTFNYSTWWLGNLWWQEMWKWSADQPIDIGSIVDANNMHSYVMTIDVDNSEFKFYKDAVLVSSSTVGSQNLRSSGFTVWSNQSTAAERNANGYVRQVVIDNSVWTAQDVLDYHNWTA